MKNLVITGAALFICSAILFASNAICIRLTNVSFALMNVSGSFKPDLTTVCIYGLSALCFIGGILATIIGNRTGK